MQHQNTPYNYDQADFLQRVMLVADLYKASSNPFSTPRQIATILSISSVIPNANDDAVGNLLSSVLPRPEFYRGKAYYNMIAFSRAATEVLSQLTNNRK